MNRQISARFVHVGIAALFIVPGAAAPVLAQAWTPLQGEGTVTVAYQDNFVKYHLFTTTQYDRGHIRSVGLLVDFTYGISDKIAVDLALPFIAAKYNGPFPHPTGLDTGDYHSSFQDLRFSLRYNVTKKGLVVTPFVGTIMPSNDYQYWAHSAVGTNVRALQVGAYWAKLLDPILPGLFVTGRYSYAFTERVLDISHNRSNLDVELGYFVKPEFRVFAVAAGQRTHGGLDFPPPPCETCGGIPLPSPYQEHHDQIGRDNVINVGGGAALNLTPSLDLFASVVHSVTGRNMHMLQYGATVGVSWSFMTPRAVARAERSRAASRGESEARKLVKCICQKEH